MQSTNPDFRTLVKTTNQGSRLSLALQNWQTFPTTIHRAIDRITESIHPPLTDPKLQTSIQQAANTFMMSIQHLVQEHLVSKRATIQNTYTNLNHTDLPAAKAIVSRQLTRTNSRLTPHSAETLISDFCTSAADREFHLVQRNTRRNPPPPTAQPATSIPLSNQFDCLATMDSDGELDTDHEEVRPRITHSNPPLSLIHI